MDVAVKVMLFQNSAPPCMSATRGFSSYLIPPSKENVGPAGAGGGAPNVDLARRMVLQEAALCCSMAHPNVLATYHFEVLQEAGLHGTQSGLSIMDQSGERAFKLYLIQVGQSSRRPGGPTLYRQRNGQGQGHRQGHRHRQGHSLISHPAGL